MAWTQAENLAPRPRPACASGHAKRGVDQLLETEATDERRQEYEPGVGHQAGLIEGHRDAVDGAR